MVERLSEVEHGRNDADRRITDPVVIGGFVRGAAAPFVYSSYCHQGRTQRRSMTQRVELEVTVTDGGKPASGSSGVPGFAPEQIDDLMSNMRSTAGSRFAAAKRLERRDRSLTRLTAFASGYIIILTVLPYILKTAPGLTDKINLATIAIAVVILVSSLLQYSSGDVLRAEQFHRSALELKELRREIKARRGTMGANEFLTDSAKYSRILEKYAVNHDDVDYLRYQLENVEEFGISDFKARVGWGKLQIANSRPAIALFAVTALCLWLGFYGLTQSPKASNGREGVACSDCVVRPSK